MSSDPSDTIDGVWTDLFAARRKPVQWIIKDLLPSGLAWVVGPPKDAKKSTQALGMGLMVAGYPSCDGVKDDPNYPGGGPDGMVHRCFKDGRWLDTNEEM